MKGYPLRREDAPWIRSFSEDAQNGHKKNTSFIKKIVKRNKANLIFVLPTFNSTHFSIACCALAILKIVSNIEFIELYDIMAYINIFQNVIFQTYYLV